MAKINKAKPSCKPLYLNRKSFAFNSDPPVVMDNVREIFETTLKTAEVLINLT